jgi:phage gp29-like protein
MDKQISKRVLGQTATTEGTPGKLGNEDAQSDVRQDYLESDAGLLCECLNETVVRWLVDYNFPGVTQYPKLEIRVQEEKDLKPQAERDKTLVSDIALPVGKKYFYDTYRIDKPGEDEEVVTPQIKNNPAGINPQELKFAEVGADSISVPDIYADRLDKQASGMVADLIDPIRSLIENAESLEAVRDGLFDLYPDMDASDLGNLMQKAFTAADLLGRYEVDNGS